MGMDSAGRKHSVGVNPFIASPCILHIDKPKRLGYSETMKTRKVYVEVKVPHSKAQRDEIPENMSLRDFLGALMLHKKPADLDEIDRGVIEEVASSLEETGLYYYSEGDSEWEERFRLIGARNLGKAGGSAKSKAKSAAARANGAKGGRPRKSK